MNWESVKEGGILHRLNIARVDVKWYGKHLRLIALVRALWITLIRFHYGEICEVCGRKYISWVATTTLYETVHGNRHGQMCPVCFTKRAKDVLGVRLTWTPFDNANLLEEIYSTGLETEQ